MYVNYDFDVSSFEAVHSATRHLVLKGLCERIDVFILHGFTQLVFKLFLVCHILLGHETLYTAT